jgi:hypothetical protein
MKKNGGKKTKRKERQKGRRNEQREKHECTNKSIRKRKIGRLVGCLVVYLTTLSVTSLYSVDDRISE